MSTPNETALSRPANNISLAEFWAKLRDYCLSNVAAAMLTVWGMLLFGGGLIVLFYFFSIRFMPELNPQASITLLTTAVLTAAFLLLGLLLLFFGPALLWKLWTHDNERLHVLCSQFAYFFRVLRFYNVLYFLLLYHFTSFA